jgi:hypothetical protein
MQDIHTYIPETNHVSRVYSVAAILGILFMVHIMLSSILNSIIIIHSLGVVLYIRHNNLWLYWLTQFNQLPEGACLQLKHVAEVSEKKKCVAVLNERVFKCLQSSLIWCMFFSLSSLTVEFAVRLPSYFRKWPCNLEFCWLRTSYRQYFPTSHLVINMIFAVIVYYRHLGLL